jgi:hypothetical protein
MTTKLPLFKYSTESGHTIIDQRFAFEEELDFGRYVSADSETRYRLIGVVVHQGKRPGAIISV